MTDIIIGNRRTSPTRPLRSAAWVGVFALVVAGTGAVTFGRLTRFPLPDGAVSTAPVRALAEGRLGYEGASLERLGRLNVYRASGSPHEIGAARGRLLAELVGPAVTSLAATLDNAVSTDGALAGATHGWRSRWRYRLIDDGIPGHQLAEHAGAWRGIAASLGDIGPEYETFVHADPPRPRRGLSRYRFRRCS